MSSFTKFLIVMLTVFSVFLCGIVVTYVASANNWKQEYNALDDQISALKKSLASEKNSLMEKEKQLETRIDELLAENNSLKADITKMEVQVSDATRENRINLQRVSDSTGVIEGLRQTIEGMRVSLDATRVDLTDKTSQLASVSKKLNEINAELDNKIVELDTLSAVNKQLLEKNSDFEKMALGQVVSTGTVTTVKDDATMISSQSPVADSAANIKGLVSEIDLKNKLVTVSVGIADGVANGMRFHVTRGDLFICDIVITNVDSDKAAGVLELVQSSPRVGDNVSTSL